ncbi:MAG: DUF2510 domain-containing protein [Acidimicrobiales bacterium]
MAMTEESSGQSASAGWHEDPNDPTITRYWDGRAWTATRQWNGNEWVDRTAPVAPPVPPATWAPSSTSGPAYPGGPSGSTGRNRNIAIGAVVAVAAIALIAFVGGVLRGGGDGGEDDEFRQMLVAGCRSEPTASAGDCECVADEILDEFSADEIVEMGLNMPSDDFTSLPPAYLSRITEALGPCLLGG